MWNDPEIYFYIFFVNPSGSRVTTLQFLPFPSKIYRSLQSLNRSNWTKRFQKSLSIGSKLTLPESKCGKRKLLGDSCTCGFLLRIRPFNCIDTHYSNSKEMNTPREYDITKFLKLRMSVNQNNLVKDSRILKSVRAKIV